MGYKITLVTKKEKQIQVHVLFDSGEVRNDLFEMNTLSSQIQAFYDGVDSEREQNIPIEVSGLQGSEKDFVDTLGILKSTTSVVTP